MLNGRTIFDANDSRPAAFQRYAVYKCRRGRLPVSSPYNSWNMVEFSHKYGAYVGRHSTLEGGEWTPWIVQALYFPSVYTNGRVMKRRRLSGIQGYLVKLNTCMECIGHFCILYETYMYTVVARPRVEAPAHCECEWDYYVFCVRQRCDRFCFRF